MLGALKCNHEVRPTTCVCGVQDDADSTAWRVCSCSMLIVLQVLLCMCSAFHCRCVNGMHNIHEKGHLQLLHCWVAALLGLNAYHKTVHL